MKTNPLIKTLISAGGGRGMRGILPSRFIQRRIKHQRQQLFKLTKWLKLAEDALDRCGEVIRHADPMLSLENEVSFDFNNLKHPEVIKVVRAFRGVKWKMHADFNYGRVTYEARIFGVQVRLWGCEPPPSMKVVELTICEPRSHRQIVRTGTLEYAMAAASQSHEKANTASP